MRVSASTSSVLRDGRVLHEVLVQRALGHPREREGGRARLRARRAAGVALLLDAPLGRVDEAPERPAPERRDLLVVGRDLDERAQQHGVLLVERGDVRQRRVQLVLGLAVAGEPDVGLLEQQRVDLLGQPHQQLALVGEVEVEGGARDAGARGDALDAQVGEARALLEQRLGRLEHGGLHGGPLGGGGRLAPALGRHRRASLYDVTGRHGTGETGRFGHDRRTDAKAAHPRRRPRGARPARGDGASRRPRAHRRRRRAGPVVRHVVGVRAHAHRARAAVRRVERGAGRLAAHASSTSGWPPCARPG